MRYEERRLLKIGKGLLSVAILAGLAACGSDSDPVPSTNTTTTTNNGSGTSSNTGGSGSASCTLATSWETSDSFELSSPNSGNAMGVFADANGALVVGTAVDSSSLVNGIVRRSTNYGSSWSTVEDAVPTSGNGIHLVKVGKGPSDGYLAVGYSGAGGNSSLAIYESSSGSSWSLASTYQYASANTMGQGFAVDGSGNLYVAVSNGNSWTVLVSDDNGSSFNVSDNFSYTGSASIADLAIDSGGNLFAAGYGTDGSGDQHWLVRELPNGGSWSTVDDYQYSGTSTNNTSAVSLFISGTTVYVAGQGNDGTANHALLRRSVSGGAFSLLKDYQYASGKNSIAKSVVEDSHGNLYLGGTGTDSSNVSHWVILQSTNSGTSWTVSDDQTPVAGSFTFKGLAADLTGDVFAVGKNDNSNNDDYWFVRELPCQ